MEFFAADADVFIGAHAFGRKDNECASVLVNRLRALERNDRIRTLRRGRARHDADRFTGSKLSFPRRACIGGALYEEAHRSSLLKFVALKGESVHGGIIEGRNVARRRKRFGKNAAQRLLQREAFNQGFRCNCILKDAVDFLDADEIGHSLPPQSKRQFLAFAKDSLCTGAEEIIEKDRNGCNT